MQPADDAYLQMTWPVQGALVRYSGGAEVSLSQLITHIHTALTYSHMELIPGRDAFKWPIVPCQYTLYISTKF